jgi:hypothetical protein
MHVDRGLLALCPLQLFRFHSRGLQRGLWYGTQYKGGVGIHSSEELEVLHSLVMHELIRQHLLELGVHRCAGGGWCRAGVNASVRPRVLVHATFSAWRSWACFE